MNGTNIIFFHSNSAEAEHLFDIKIIDSNQMFKPTCTFQPHIMNETLCACDIRFAKHGRLDEPSYCFQLKAFDTSPYSRAYDTSDICVVGVQETNEVIDKLYPDEVFLLKSASRFARVAQPLQDTTEAGFMLSTNPFGALNITPTGGIIYVEKPGILAAAHPASSIKLEVTWKEHQKQQIDVIIQPENNQCRNVKDICARHDNQADCESSCGIGSSDGSCKWRAHQGFELMSKIFSTCVPDLKFCSNEFCDQLEMMGSSLSQHICPQDCTKNVIGSANTKLMGISGSSKGNVCTCDEHETCVCGPVELETPSTELPATTTKAPSDQFLFLDDCDDKCQSTLAFVLGTIFAAAVAVLSVFFCNFRRQMIPFEGIEAGVSPEASYVTSRTRTSSAGSSAVLEEIFERHVQNDTPVHPDFCTKRWQMDALNVSLLRTLGEGEYGKVMLATMPGSKDGERVLVVIKTVKDIENESEMTSLKKEFEQLQKVSVRPHQNVINLIGCCSKGPTPWIFLEFCVFESLKEYLLASRLISLRKDTEGVDKVTIDDILKFSLQIANGMAHLAMLKLVHRDLAARNVLLSEGKICKISDFGLTRNVCKSCDTYSKCSDDKVPVKWLAPESLSISEEYSTKSDVWAFGVLGYELIMLGSSPYPDISVNHFEILNLLINGYRMKCPENCRMELFGIFESCWNSDPAKRPSFEELAGKFQQLISFVSIHNQTEPIWTTPLISSSEHYDANYYKEYILRVEETLFAFKPPPAQKKKQPSRKTASTNKLLCHSVDNVNYDSSFNAIKSMLMRQQKNESNTTMATEVTSVSFSSLASSSSDARYLPMNKSSSTLISSSVVAESPDSNVESGYITMDSFVTKTSSFP